MRKGYQFGVAVLPIEIRYLMLKKDDEGKNRKKKKSIQLKVKK